MLEPKDICIYYPTYCDVKVLKRGTTIAKRFGFTVLVGDGRYTDFPQIRGSDYSHDGTLEYCKENDIHYFKAKPMREQDKVNIAIKTAKDLGCKVFMMQGADSYLVGDIDEFMLNLQREYDRVSDQPVVMFIRTVEEQKQDKWNNTASRQPRVWFNYWKLELRHLHWCIYIKGAKDDDPLHYDQTMIEGLVCHHDNSLRPRGRDDMMTRYQDTNVERERELFLEKVAKRVWGNVNLLVWHEDSRGTYQEARLYYLKMQEVYSHLLFIRKGYSVTHEDIRRLRNLLEHRNNIHQHIQVLTGVWKVGKHWKQISLDPMGTYSFMKWPTEAIKKLYSPKGTDFKPDDYLLALPFTGGPIYCMEKDVVDAVGDISDDLTLFHILKGLYVQIFAYTRVRFKWQT